MHVFSTQHAALSATVGTPEFTHEVSNRIMWLARHDGGAALLQRKVERRPAFPVPARGDRVHGRVAAQRAPRAASRQRAADRPLGAGGGEAACAGRGRLDATAAAAAT